MQGEVIADTETMGQPLLQLVMGVIAVVTAWQLARSWISGTIIDENWTATADENPVSYAVGMITQAGIVAFSSYLALGYPMPDFMKSLSGL